jgi:hypothetical protein
MSAKEIAQMKRDSLMKEISEDSREYGFFKLPR